MASSNRTKKKIKKEIADGIAHIHATFNNTIRLMFIDTSRRRSPSTTIFAIVPRIASNCSSLNSLILIVRSIPTSLQILIAL
jgi:hypothetical protein